MRDALGPGVDVLSVGELSRCLRAIIEAEDLFRDVWIRGEVSNLTKHSSGHVYFCLKDESALIRCVIWNGTARSMRFSLDSGMRLLVRGRVGVYEKQGYYQIIVNEAMPDGIGELYTAFEQLKARLQGEGLFDSGHKKGIPPFPGRIAILTSRTAAALRDMVTVSRRRFPGIHLLVVPTLMQGDDAPASIVQSLRLADAIPDIDVIVLGRGGGSIEDLWAFNTEPVVRAIFSCSTPVVSAIGHETDFTLSDFVADLRAPTPSAAMELVVPDASELMERIRSNREALAARVVSRIDTHRARLSALVDSPSLRFPERMIETRWQSLDMAEDRLRSRFDGVLSSVKHRFGEICGRLESLSPLGVLSRGYSITRRQEDGLTMRCIADAPVGGRIETLLMDGMILSEIVDVKEGPN